MYAVIVRTSGRSISSSNSGGIRLVDGANVLLTVGLRGGGRNKHKGKRQQFTHGPIEELEDPSKAKARERWQSKHGGDEDEEDEEEEEEEEEVVKKKTKKKKPVVRAWLLLLLLLRSVFVCLCIYFYKIYSHFRVVAHMDFLKKRFLTSTVFQSLTVKKAKRKTRKKKKK